jgi:preprotein translocase subunit SecF
MIPNIYKGEYRLLLIFPLILIAASLYLLPNLKMGVDFRGGTLITLQVSNQPDAAAVQSDLLAAGFDANVKLYESELGRKMEIEVSQTEQMYEADALKTEFSAQLDKVAQLEAESNQNASKEEEYEAERDKLYDMADRMFVLSGSNTEAEFYLNLNALKAAFNDAYMHMSDLQTSQVMDIVDRSVEYTSKSAVTVSPALSKHFIEQAFNVVIFSAILSTILVFIFFRTLVPSLAVLTGAASDVIIALGGMCLFGIPLTLPSFAALLMLIGFSLDTDVLLTTRLVKRKGDPRENAFDAMKTGMTMSFSAMVAFLVLFAVSMITHITVYYEISAVALAGLVGDVFATWGLNAVMVLWYKEHETKRVSK